MLNQSIHMSKNSNYKNLAPIAPAPLLAPKPSNHTVTIKPLPKPITPALKHHSNTNGTQNLPCIITSKQWVLPLRPKAGRKPTTSEKKAKSVANAQMTPSNSTQSLTSLSNNMTGLNLKAKSENMKLQVNEDLKLQLENATEENQKLKNIIFRLKNEIESLKTSSPNSLPNDPHFSSPPSITAMNDITIGPMRNGSVPSEVNNNGNIREISPTVDPKFIGIANFNNRAATTTQKRTKRQYNKKKKKDAVSVAVATSNTLNTTITRKSNVKNEDSPSPISLTIDNLQKQEQLASDLPKVDSILTSNNSTHTITHEDDIDSQPSKRSKTLKLERSMSLQTHDLMLSPPPSSFNLDRSLSTPLDPFEFNMHVGGLSRTTTITTIDNEFGWDHGVPKNCSLCKGDECLCLDKQTGYNNSNDDNNNNNNAMNTRDDDINLMKNATAHDLFKKDMNMINENDELIDMNLFLETENNEFNLLM